MYIYYLPFENMYTNGPKLIQKNKQYTYFFAQSFPKSGLGPLRGLRGIAKEDVKMWYLKYSHYLWFFFSFYVIGSGKALQILLNRVIY